MPRDRTPDADHPSPTSEVEPDSEAPRLVKPILVESNRTYSREAMRRLMQSDALILIGGTVLLLISLLVGLLGWTGVLGPYEGPSSSPQRPDVSSPYGP